MAMTAFLCVSCSLLGTDKPTPTTQSFTVSFNPNGGTGTMANQTITEGASAALNGNTFIRSGYTFSGWAATSDAATASWADRASYTMGNANATLFAVWMAGNSQTITFNANGGSGTMANQTIAQGASANLTMNTFTRAGYTFAGWATSATATAATYANGASYAMGSADVILYAIWTAASTGTAHTITFNANGGSGTMAAQTIAQGSSAALTKNTFTRSGYEFIGWAKNASATSYDYYDSMSYTMGTTDVILYAVWVIPITTRTLTSNETWTGAVTLTTNITVPSGRTLTIAPGTIVSMHAGNSYYTRIEIYIQSGGSMIASGTAGSPIIFRSDSLSPKDNDWDSIGVSGGSLTMKYCVVEDVYYGIFEYSSLSGSSSISVSNSCFTNCDQGIVSFYSGSTIKNVSFDDCYYGYWDFSGQTNALSLCAFSNLSGEGLMASESNTTLNVSYSNFSSNYKDVEIFGSTSTTDPLTNVALNLSYCYPAAPTQYIYGTTNTNCAINITNPSAVSNSTAGCGFDYSAYKRAASARSSLNGRTEFAAGGAVDREEIILGKNSRNVQRNNAN